VATTVVIIAAALVAAAVVLAVVVSRRHSSTAPQADELVRAVDEMRTKMDELAGELSEALERAEQESRRNRLFGELGGSIDLEELMDRVLDAAMEIPGFDAAMMVVERQDGAPAVVTRGMTADESARPPTSGVVGVLPGTITVSYRYGRDREGAELDLIRGGAFIPLMGRELRPVASCAPWEPCRCSGARPTTSRAHTRSSRRSTSPRAPSRQSRTRAATARRASSRRRTR
jgi:hypothetical protein